MDTEGSNTSLIIDRNIMGERMEGFTSCVRNRQREKLGEKAVLDNQLESDKDICTQLDSFFHHFSFPLNL